MAIVSAFETLLQADQQDGCAVIDRDVRVGRKDLFAEARARAEWFTDSIEPDERIAFVDTNDYEAVVTILGALLAGRSLAMVPHRDRGELEVRAAEARCGAIATGSNLEVVRRGLNDDPRIDPRFGTDLHGSPEAVVLYTSGTTGAPKGIRLSQRNITTNLTAVMRQTGPWAAGDRLGLVLALTHSYGLSMVLLALAQRAPIVMLGGGAPGQATAHIVKSERVTVLAAVPYYLRLMARRGFHLGSDTFAPYLRALFLAGGGISDEELDHVAPGLHAKTFLMYGLTEATARVAIRRRGDGAPSGSVGLPLPGTFVDIVGQDGRPLPAGQPGRIRVNSASLLIGLLGEEPRDPGVPHVTTDIGRLDEAGNLYITGRAAEMLNFRGNRVSLVEQESRLTVLPGIRAARLVPESHDEDAQCFVQLVLAEGADPSLVKRSVLSRVEPRGLVKKVIFVDHLETTRSGKPIRRTVDELGLA